MGSSLYKFAGDAVRSVAVNIIRLGISAAMTLLLPKLMGIAGYGYWQLYLFYTSYAVFSSLGICEGLYLECGGAEYDSLYKSLISGQIWLLTALEAAICGFSWLIVLSLGAGGIGGIVLSLAFTSAALDIPRYALQSVLQASGRIKAYARIQGLERLLFFVCAAACLLCGKTEYYHIAGAEILARLVSAVYAFWVCRDVAINRPPPLRTALRTSLRLIKSGAALLLAAFSGQLTLGAARFAVLWKWGEGGFGELSLAFSLANIVITCAAGIGIALFPFLKRAGADALARIYPAARMALLLPVLIAAVIYAPLKHILSAWLPGYGASLYYLAVLLPICVFETRTAMLTDTYFKACKRVDLMLSANLASAGFSMISAFLAALFSENILSVVITTIIASVLKSILSELLLNKCVQCFSIKAICLELIFAGVFTLSNFLLGGYPAFMLNLAVFALFLFINRKRLRAAAVTAKFLRENGAD